MSMDQDAGLTEVLAANEHFYDVFRSGDMAAMYELWSSRESISVYHPNWPGISGRDDVMTSWHQVMVMGAAGGIRQDADGDPAGKDGRRILHRGDRRQRNDRQQRFRSGERRLEIDLPPRPTAARR